MLALPVRLVVIMKEPATQEHHDNIMLATHRLLRLGCCIQHLLLTLSSRIGAAIKNLDRAMASLPTFEMSIIVLQADQKSVRCPTQTKRVSVSKPKSFVHTREKCSFISSRNFFLCPSISASGGVRRTESVYHCGVGHCRLRINLTQARVLPDSKMSHPNPPDGDADMTEPEQPRGYNVPLPPEPPSKVDEHGNITLEFWSDIRDRYTVRLRDDKTYFEIREFNDDDPTGMGRRFEGDWPKMYSMGPPSEAPDYNPIHEKYGLKILNAAGYINSIYPTESMTFGPMGRLYGSSFRNPTWDPAEKIHPVLRSHMWQGVSDEQYASLYPALNLASAILDDPTTLNYFYALSRPASSMTTVVDPDTNLTCKIMDIPDALTETQQRETYQLIWDMQIYTYFTFKDMATSDYDVYGVTKPTLDSNCRMIPAARP